MNRGAWAGVVLSVVVAAPAAWADGEQPVSRERVYLHVAGLG